MAWKVDLGGPVRGQPLVADGRVFAATEQNRVAALNPASGAIVWSVSLGTPLTRVAAVAGCGNIDPLGVTSTPVIDTSTGMLYVVAEINDGGGKVHHQLFGLRIADGATVVSDDVDPPLPHGEQALHLLQRAGLTIANGRVYVAYGGNYGDCGTYHGWVVSVAETGSPNTTSFEVAADGQGGAIWQSGGAPAIDSVGDLYVTTGNANPDPPAGGPDPKQYTESVVKLSPTLKPLAAFKDRIAGGDEDLSTGNPVLLPDGTVFSVGKTDVGYLLRQSDLSRVASISGICGSDPDGGPAFDAATDRMFVACRGGGIQVVDLRAGRAIARLAGVDSAPLVVGATVWSVDHARGTLSGYSTTTLARTAALSLGTLLPIFTSPSAGLGLMLLGDNNGVIAIR